MERTRRGGTESALARKLKSDLLGEGKAPSLFLRIDSRAREEPELGLGLPGRAAAKRMGGRERGASSRAVLEPDWRLAALSRLDRRASVGEVDW